MRRRIESRGSPTWRSWQRRFQLRRLRRSGQQGRRKTKRDLVSRKSRKKRDSRNEWLVVSYALCFSERSNMIRTGMCPLAIKRLLLILAWVVLVEECGQKSGWSAQGVEVRRGEKTASSGDHPWVILKEGGINRIYIYIYLRQWRSQWRWGVKKLEGAGFPSNASW